MDLRRRRNFTREQRKAIIEEYDHGPLTGAEIAQKYGIKSPSLIFTWRKRLEKGPKYLQKSKKSSTFVTENELLSELEVPMKKKSQEELEAEVKRLTKELEWAQLQNKALNIMIDIAESQGIRIRKKSGAKQ